MRKTIMLITALMLTLWLVTGVGAQGLSYPEPPWVGELPEIEPAPWESGQYAVYNLAVAAGGENISGDIRIAIVGEESIGGENFYWFELDLYNIGNLPEDLQMGEDEFESLKVQLLMKRI